MPKAENPRAHRRRRKPYSNGRLENKSSGDDFPDGDHYPLSTQTPTCTNDAGCSYWPDSSSPSQSGTLSQLLDDKSNLKCERILGETQGSADDNSRFRKGSEDKKCAPEETTTENKTGSKLKHHKQEKGNAHKNNRCKEDPEYRQMKKEKAKAYQRAKYLENPQYKQKKLKDVQTYQKNQYRNNPQFRFKKLEESRNQYQRKHKEREDIHIVIKDFKEKCLESPSFICVCCNRRLFRNQVVIFSLNKYRDKKQLQLCISANLYTSTTDYDITADAKVKLWICYTCRSHLLKGNIPPQATVNSLSLDVVPQELASLNTLEQQCIALKLPFMKLVTLQNGSHKTIEDPVVMVPAMLDAEETKKSLPRSMEDSRILEIDLDGELQFNGQVECGTKSAQKVSTAIQKLKLINSYYEDITLISKLPDENSFETFDESLDSNQPVDENSLHEDGDAEDQFYKQGQDTCLQSLDTFTDALIEMENSKLQITPRGDIKHKSIFMEKESEAKSFPTLFPTGQNTYDESRVTKISKNKYFNARLLSADLRFSQNSAYIFYALHATDLDTILSNISIQMRKGRAKLKSEEKVTAGMIGDSRQLKDEDKIPWMSALRGTPEYWKKTMDELIAMVRQIGLPTWYCTFSASEFSRWPEVIGVIMRQRGKNDEYQSLNLEEKFNILRNDPVTAVQMFNHRVSLFMKDVIKSPAHPIGRVKDYFYRVNFQLRGPPIIHCLFWIFKAPKIGRNPDEDVCKFVDLYISSKQPSETDDPELHEIVMSVQKRVKKHSHSCKNSNKECRCLFPRPISSSTSITRRETPQEEIEEKYYPNHVFTVQKEEEQTVMSREGFIAETAFSNIREYKDTVKSIIMKREPNDVWINNYNPHLLRAWNANMDIQFVLHAYHFKEILSCICEGKQELGPVLQFYADKLQKVKKNEESTKRLKDLGIVYFENKEVSVQEAVARTCGFKLKDTSRSVIFIPTDENSLKISKPFLKIQELTKQDTDSDDIWMTSWNDKYKARPCEPAEFDSMCLAEFVSECTDVSETNAQKGTRGVYPLQGQLGYIRRRGKGREAIIRYPTHSPTKYPEEHHHSLLKLFLPHRSESELKPIPFKSYEDVHSMGVVEQENIKDIVRRNQLKYEKHVPNLDGLQQKEAKAVAQVNVKAEDQNEFIAEPCEHLGNTDTSESKDTDLCTKNQGNLCSLELMGEQIKPLLCEMNLKQKEIFYYVRQWCLKSLRGENPNPFYVFVDGGAGVGKSHLIKCIYNEASKLLQNGESHLNTTVLLTASTGTAAFRVGGFTVHSALEIPIYLKPQYEPLTGKRLHRMQTKLGNLKILIIDEISMINRKQLAYIHGRLKQVKRESSTYRDAFFGNVSVLAVGDFYQLPPVKDNSLKDNSLIIPDRSLGADIWYDIFEKVVLRDIMRQKDDIPFARILNDLRKKKMKENLSRKVNNALQSRTKIDRISDEILRIFAHNKRVDNHNEAMLKRYCKNPIPLEAEDYKVHKFTNRRERCDCVRTSDKRNLLTSIRLDVGARVMLTRNVDLSDGLVNGAFGTVLGFEQDSHQSKVTAVYVQFDSERTGKKQRPHKNRSIQVTAIEVRPHEEELHNKSLVIRRQFPLKLAWACTIHKTQGLSIDRCVIDMEGIFQPGQAYVALSRVTSLNGLFLNNYYPELIYMNESIDTHIKEMKCLQVATMEMKPANDLRIIHHNVQGLSSKLLDIQNNTSVLCEVIMVTESCMSTDVSDERLQLKNYNIHRRDKSDISVNDEVAIYTSKTIIANRLDTGINSTEHIALEIQWKTMQLQPVLVISVYRSESGNLNLFSDSLAKLLNFSSKFDTVIVAGNFNEDLLGSGAKPIYELFMKNNFKQMIHEPTTTCGEQLDAVYVKTKLTVKGKVIPTYYSDHEAVLTTLYANSD